MINQWELHTLELHAKYKAPNMMRTGRSQELLRPFCIPRSELLQGSQQSKLLQLLQQLLKPDIFDLLIIK